MKLPECWVSARLGDACVLNPRLSVEERPDETTGVTFVPMSAVDEFNGTIAKPEARPFGEVAKGYSSFRQNDVLFAKVTPCMENGKIAVAGELLNGLGFGSSEFHVIRPTEVVLPEYIFHFVRQEIFRDRAASAFVGTGGLQRVPTEFLSRIKLPLPPLPEQQRIVDMLRQAESFGKDREQRDSMLQALCREFYSNLFGNVFRNDEGWPIRSIGQMSDVVRGSSPRPQGDPRLFGGPVPRLMVSDLTRDGLWVDATTDSLTIEGAKSSRPISAQSVVIAVSGAPGLTAILNHDACIHDGFVGLRDLQREMLPEYVAFTLNLLRAKNDQQAVGAVFRNLNTDQVKAITIPSPPLALQTRFRNFLLQVRIVQQNVAQEKLLLDELLRTLTADAFSGELTAHWRDNHQAEISIAAGIRDVVLRERGTKITAAATIGAELSSSAPIVTVQFSARQWLLRELSEFQRQVLTAFLEYPEHPLLVEDSETFSRFCDDEDVTKRLAAFEYSSNSIRRTLGQLAALGLIAKVTHPRLGVPINDGGLLTAFRPLREGENTRLGDVEALRRAVDGAKADVVAETNA